MCNCPRTSISLNSADDLNLGRLPALVHCVLLLCNWRPSLRRDPLTHARHTPTHALSHTWPCRPSPSGLCPRALALLAHRHFACGFHDTTRFCGMKPETPRRASPSYVYEPATANHPSPTVEVDAGTLRLWDSGNSHYGSDPKYAVPRYPDYLLQALRTTVHTEVALHGADVPAAEVSGRIPQSDTQDPSLID